MMKYCLPCGFHSHPSILLKYPSFPSRIHVCSSPFLLLRQSVFFEREEHHWMRYRKIIFGARGGSLIWSLHARRPLLVWRGNPTRTTQRCPGVVHAEGEVILVPAWEVALAVGRIGQRPDGEEKAPLRTSS